MESFRGTVRDGLSAKGAPISRRSALRLAAIAAALIAVTLAAFHGVLSSGFVDFDDDAYVIANVEVQHGLRAESIAWAFTTTAGANWHPVTWLSHMLDVQLFGLDAGKHHRTSLLLHAANVVLLFLLLVEMTGAVWRGALVAALFAIHPLHVESVAWVAERKDVLSTLFWFLTLAAWLRYIAKKTPARHAQVLALYACGLMSKPMLVTLPFTLLLLDYWPLSRWQPAAPGLVREKAPLFAMAAISSVVTFFAQRGGRAVESLELLSPAERVANAACSYATYLGKTFWPSALAVFYPHAHRGLLAWPVVLSALLLAAVTLLALRLKTRAPYLAVGWFWYVGTLVPVIGLVQVGAQARADRYTYLPLVGVFVAIAWGLAELETRIPNSRVALVSAAVVALAALCFVTAAQVRHWADDVSLFGHAVAVTSDNAPMQANLGLALFDRGDVDQAIAHDREALRISPGYKRALGNLALALATRGDDAGAIQAYERVLEIDSGDAVIHFQLARALARAGRADEAVSHYGEALRLNPAYPEAHDNLANLLADRGRTSDALLHYEASLRLRPDNAVGRYNLANVLIAADRLDEASAQLAESLRLRPDFAEAHNALGVVLMRQGRTPEAASQFVEALRLRPDLQEVRRNLEAARAPR